MGRCGKGAASETNPCLSLTHGEPSDPWQSKFPSACRLVKPSKVNSCVRFVALTPASGSRIAPFYRLGTERVGRPHSAGRSASETGVKAEDIYSMRVFRTLTVQRG